MRVTVTKDESTKVLEKARNIAYSSVIVGAVVGYDFSQWKTPFGDVSAPAHVVNSIFMVVYVGCLVSACYLVWSSFERLKAVVRSSSDGLAITAPAPQKDFKRLRKARAVVFLAIILAANSGFAFWLWRHRAGLWVNANMGLNLVGFIFAFGMVWAWFDDLKSTIAHTYEFNPETGQLADALDEDESPDPAAAQKHCRTPQSTKS